MSDLPRMIYRDGSAVEIWGRKVDTRIVSDADELGEALASGWRLRPDPVDPLDHDGDGRRGGSLPRQRNRRP